MVLEGTFSDEFGDFGAGTYVRTLPQSAHSPHSDGGCVVFVKHWQFDLSDRTAVTISTAKSFFVRDALHGGVGVMPLFEDERETVHLERCDSLCEVTRDFPEGGELFVLEGSFTADDGEPMRRWSWLAAAAAEHRALRRRGRRKRVQSVAQDAASALRRRARQRVKCSKR